MSAPADFDLDEINHRLAEISVLLEGAERDPSPTHFALLSERDRLRAEATHDRSLKDASRSTVQLEAELAALRRQRQHSIRSRTGYITGKGGNNQGPASGAWVKLAQQTREAGDISRISRRIAEIEQELARRGSDV